MGREKSGRKCRENTRPRDDVMKYYVYLHYVVANGKEVPLYIGKGTGDRDHLHLNAAYRRTMRKPGLSYPRYYRALDQMKIAGQVPHVRRLVENVDEATAFQWERFFILAVGRRGNKRNPGTLYNRCEGGCGFTSRDYELIGESVRVSWKKHGPREGHRFRGVRKDGKSYRANVSPLGYHIYSVCVPTEEEAAHLYDALALRWLGPDPYLNFPESV